MRLTFRLSVLCSVFIVMVAWTARLSAVDSLQTLRQQFTKPSREYCTAPLWVWNDMITDEQVIGTLRDLAGQNVRQAFVHPRPGLMTPYLSKEWFRLWKLALSEAEKLDMNLWIYEENSYPSGFAGGLVPEAMPESRGRGIAMDTAKNPPQWSDEIVGVYLYMDNEFKNISHSVKLGKDMPEGKYLVAKEVLAPHTPWNGGMWYVDLLRPGVTEKFLEITMDAYKREIGSEFGKRVPGVFTDEPELRPANGLSWTPGLPEAFQKRWGYSLLDSLPSLVEPVGDWKKVRHDYYRLLNELFIERWSRPSSEYYERNGLEWTGHYWEHDWPLAIRVPDSMAMAAWHHRPAIDILLNNYSEGLHAQFGNVRSVRELASVANQMGRKRTLCETYGAAGWDLRFEDMKRIGDWLYVLGINTMDEHLSYISMRGARKHDHPQSFSYHTPWWNEYNLCATYFARLSVAMSSGHQLNSILLLEPTSTAWMYNNGKDVDEPLRTMATAFEGMVRNFELQQVEYDIGCEDVIARHGSVKDGTLVVGKRAYQYVVIPPKTETLNSKTLDLLEACLAGGGHVFCVGDPPVRVDGRESGRVHELAKKPNWKKVDASTVPGLLLAAGTDGFKITRTQDDKGILFHQRRQLEAGELLLLVNTSIKERTIGTITARAGSVEQWDPATGKMDPYKHIYSEPLVTASYDLPPSGSLLLYLDKTPKPYPKGPVEKTVVMTLNGPPQIRRIDPNVLTLDYVDVTAGGESRKGLHTVHAANYVFARHGMERNIWDRAVQLRDTLITKTFPPDSGFEATYHFTVENSVPSPLFFVVERGDLYTITCNGQPLAASRGSWWLDRQFTKIDISKVAKVGANAVTIKASPFTVYHEIAEAYVLGNMSLKSTDSGFVVAPPVPLMYGKWNEQGCPMYGHGVKYVQRFDVAGPDGKYYVQLPAWYGSVATVMVNGQSAGVIAFPPWECEVTDVIRAGENMIDICVIGTLKNTCGPFHNNPPLGIAGPGSWDNAPEPGPPSGSRYSTVGYGMFKPFILKQVVPEEEQ